MSTNSILTCDCSGLHFSIQSSLVDLEQINQMVKSVVITGINKNEIKELEQQIELVDWCFELHNAAAKMFKELVCNRNDWKQKERMLILDCVFVKQLKLYSIKCTFNKLSGYSKLETESILSLWHSGYADDAFTNSIQIEDLQKKLFDVGFYGVAFNESMAKTVQSIDIKRKIYFFQGYTYEL